MKYVRLGLGLAFVYIVLFLLVVPVASQYPYPDPPATYYGRVQASATFTPAVGMHITAWISDTLCGAAYSQEATSGEVVYAIQVAADWADAPGCGAPGRTVHFEVDAHPMQPSVMWDNSQLYEVDLFLADVVLPQVTAVLPVHGAWNVARNQPLAISFNKALDTGTVAIHITPTVTLTPTWSNDDTYLTLNHTPFAASTRYTVTVMGSDLAGNPLASPYTWAFTTGAELAPEADLSLGKVREGSGSVMAGERITYTLTITNGGPTSPVSATVVDTFSDAPAIAGAMAGVSAAGCVWAGAEIVTCTVTGIVTTTPAVLTLVVTTSATYSGTLHNSATVAPAEGVVDPDAGNNNAGPISVSVQYTPGDITPPTVIAVSPTHGAEDVARNAPVVVDFSEAMATGSVNMLISPTVGGLVETWGNGNTRLTLNHEDFAASTHYTVTVTGSDLAGNPMVSPYTWAFTTGAEVAPEADLSLGKVRAGSGVVTAGERITYTFTITNAGPTSPVTTTLVDVFSDASALVDVSEPGCTWAGTETVTCTVTGVVTDMLSVLMMVVETSEVYSGTLENSASIIPVGNVADPATENNMDGPVSVKVETRKVSGDSDIYLPLVLRNL